MSSKTLVIAPLLSLGLLILAGPLAAQSPGAGDAMARCAEALGGDAAWRAVKSMELSGIHSSYTQDHPLRILRQRPNLYRNDHAEGTRAFTVAFDGELAWLESVIIFNTQGDWPLIARTPFDRMIRDDAEFEMPCLNLEQRDIQIEPLGERQLEGGESYPAFEVTLSSGSIEFWYLDKESHLPQVRESTSAYQGRDAKQFVYFSQYRDVGDVVIPYYWEIEIGNDFRQYHVQEVRLNVDIDPAVFSLPLAPGMEQLKHLAGHWRVAVESFDPLLRSWHKETVAAVIESVSRGDLLEEDIAFMAAGLPLEMKRLYSYDRFRDVFRVVYFDNFTSHADILEGTLEDGRLVVSNVPTGTPWTVYEHTFHARETLSEMTADGFKLERERSADGGKTWLPDYRLTYQRAK